MVGRRKAKGQAVRRVESMRRAVGLYSARLSRATTPTQRVRVAADMTCALLARADERTAQAHSDALVQAMTRTVRDLQKEVRG